LTKGARQWYFWVKPGKVLGKNGENEMISSKSYTGFNIKPFLKFEKTFLDPEKYFESLSHYGYFDDRRYASFLCDFSAWAYKSGLCQHYFIEKGLEDFLQSSIKEVSPTYWGKLPNKKYDNSMLKLEKYCNGVDTIHTPIALHFYKNSGFESLLVNMVSDNLGNQYVSIDSNKGQGIALDPNTATEEKIKEFDDISKRRVRTVLGFSLYVDAFPDLIHPHLENVKIWKIYNGERSYISKGEEVKEDCLHSVSPHYRRGHFKLLTHERYKKKRGQVIFTKGTFVKGRAYDVITD
jgi:hypothetical protein